MVSYFVTDFFFSFSFRLLGIFWKCARIGKYMLFLPLLSFLCIKDVSLEVFYLSIYFLFYPGERKSPWVACCCIIMAFSILFLQ